MKLLICIIFVILCQTSFAKPNNSVIWATPIWEHYSEPNVKGLYGDILTDIFSSNNIEIKQKIVPWKRALSMIDNNRADITGGLVKDNLGNDSKYPISIDEEGILYRESSIKEIKSIDDLNEYFGTWYAGFFSGDHTKESVLKGVGLTTRVQALNMLFTENRSVDYLYDEKNLIFQTLDELGLHALPKGYKYQKMKTSKLFMRFSNSEKGQIIKSDYDKGIEIMFCSGNLIRTYKKWAVSMPKLDITCPIKK
jgi:polar amino acid transport system substrate-binding protein